ncbi:MAG: TonB-dependent receptor plug domain-containing protein [Thermoanaerobaculia bacterium]
MRDRARRFPDPLLLPSSLRPDPCVERRRERRGGGLALLALAIAALAAPGARAEVATAPAAPPDPVFHLGTVLVTARSPEVGEVASEQAASVLTLKEIRRRDRETVAGALALLPGVTLSTNVRNEQTVFVRGFDSRQVPLFIDGIPVSVAYDGTVDLGRFLTADVGAIQLTKGFSSVAYGPNTLGGAINLVSRRPSTPFEADASVGLGDGKSRHAWLNAGSDRGSWYVQLGAAYREAKSFRLSSGFVATPLEDGGARDNSDSRDTRLSLKVGLTPARGNEYALTFVRQNGEKGQPPSTVPPARYWRWPEWDKTSLYLVTRTALGARETLRTRLFLDRFDNEARSYTDGTYTVLKTSGPGSIGTGRSLYDDRTDGGMVEVESTRFARQTLRVVVHLKSDRHEEADGSAQLLASMEDRLWSVSGEDTLALSARTRLSVGLAHHVLGPREVYRSSGTPYSLPPDANATDTQAGLFHDAGPAARLYATFAVKTRLPTLKDRYSQRLGLYLENPDLGPERALSWEAGYQGSPWRGARAEAALFWSDTEDRIQSVNLSGAPSCTSATPCQMRNVGETRARGLELRLSASLGKAWEVGGDATLSDLENVSSPATKVLGIPETRIALWATWCPVEAIELGFWAAYETGRWASDRVKLDGLTTADVKASWRLPAGLSLEGGLRNLADESFELEYGFPAPGRTWFANLRYEL